MSVDTIVTERVNGTPHGIPAIAPQQARASTRVRARVATTLRDGKVVKRVTSAASTVRADLAGSWLLRNQPPSFVQMWAQRKPALTSVPDGNTVLYRVELVWRTAAVFILWPLFGYLWLLHRAVTGIPTVVVTAALLAMWLS